MGIDNPEGTDDRAPLSFSEGVAAFLNQEASEAPAEGQADEVEEEQGEAVDEAEEVEGGETEEEQPDEEQQDEEPPAPSYASADAKVKLADGSEVTVADLINGGMRLQDYRRKTEEVSVERKAVAAKSQEIASLEQRMEQDRQFMMDWLETSIPPKPDRSLIHSNPLGYQDQLAAHQEAVERYQHIQAAQQEAQQRRSAEEAQALKERQQREWEATLEVIPDLKDPNKLKSFMADVQTHGNAYGFTPREMADALSGDNRQVQVMRDAIAWRKLQESKPKVQSKVENRPPVQRGGNRLTPEASRAKDIRAAKDRLTKSGSIKDAVAFALELEKG